MAEFKLISKGAMNFWTGTLLLKRLQWHAWAWESHWPSHDSGRACRWWLPSHGSGREYKWGPSFVPGRECKRWPSHRAPCPGSPSSGWCRGLRQWAAHPGPHTRSEPNREWQGQLRETRRISNISQSITYTPPLTEVSAGEGATTAVHTSRGLRFLQEASQQNCE